MFVSYHQVFHMSVVLHVFCLQLQTLFELLIFTCSFRGGIHLFGQPNYFMLLVAMVQFQLL